MSRRHWKLCSRHESCSTCKNALESWKHKAQKSAWNAVRLKYALECILRENHEVIYERRSEDDVLLPITHDMNTVPTPNDILTNWTCGICHENHCKIGPHRPVIFNCTHSVCAECYSHPTFLRVRKCPYCRDTLLSRAVLLVFNS